jgi:preprotein translocase subunit SecG
MHYVFGLLTIVASSLLILIVVIQNSKGGGLNSAFGTSNLTSMIGTRRATQDIEKFTWYLAVILLLFSFVANVSGGKREIAEEPKFGTMNTNVQAPAAQPSASPVQQVGGEGQ